MNNGDTKGQDAADRVWLEQVDATQWTVRLNSSRAKKFANWEFALAEALKISRSHQAPIWISDGTSRRPFKAR